MNNNNPGHIVQNQIIKPGPLGGAMTRSETTHPISGDAISEDLGPSHDYSPEATKKELDKLGLTPTSEVEVTDPVSGKKTMITIDRTGTTESKLLIALADKNLNRDQKDAVLSMYLFERGKESASFLMDLMRFKGFHTKETRAFKSQVRFDFEMYVSLSAKCFDDAAFAIGLELGYSREEFRELGLKYVEFIKDCEKREDPDRTVFAFTKVNRIKMSREKAALIRQAFQNLESALLLKQSVANTAAARERDNGKGIYIDGAGKPYSCDDPEINDVIKKDQERLAELKKQDNG